MGKLYGEFWDDVTEVCDVVGEFIEDALSSAWRICLWILAGIFTGIPFVIWYLIKRSRRK